MERGTATEHQPKRITWLLARTAYSDGSAERQQNYSLLKRLFPPGFLGQKWCLWAQQKNTIWGGFTSNMRTGAQFDPVRCV